MTFEYHISLSSSVGCFFIKSYKNPQQDPLTGRIPELYSYLRVEEGLEIFESPAGHESRILKFEELGEPSETGRYLTILARRDSEGHWRIADGRMIFPGGSPEGIVLSVVRKNFPVEPFLNMRTTPAEIRNSFTELLFDVPDEVILRQIQAYRKLGDAIRKERARALLYEALATNGAKPTSVRDAALAREYVVGAVERNGWREPTKLVVPLANWTCACGGKFEKGRTWGLTPVLIGAGLLLVFMVAPAAAELPDGPLFGTIARAVGIACLLASLLFRGRRVMRCKACGKTINSD